MAAPGYYYFFVGPAVAAVFMLVINALAIVFSSSVKQLVVAGGMKREELQRRIPARMYQRKEGEGEEECSVCLSAFLDGQRVRRLLRCGHWFHVSCIDKWLMSHATCPICRADVLSPVRPFCPPVMTWFLGLSSRRQLLILLEPLYLCLE